MLEVVRIDHKAIEGLTDLTAEMERLYKQVQ